MTNSICIAPRSASRRPVRQAALVVAVAVNAALGRVDSSAVAQQPDVAAAAPDAGASRGPDPSGGAAGAEIVAYVGQWPIDRAEVERVARQSVATWPADLDSRAALRASALENLIRREVVHQYLERGRQKASDDEVDKALAKARTYMDARGEEFNAWLALRGQTEAKFRWQLSWEIGWKKFLAEILTDDTLQKYFAQHRRDFDGTEVRASHLLLAFKSDAAVPGNRQQEAAELVAEAADIRRRIQAGELSFDDAVRRYSQGPSRDQDGDLGDIRRHGPMVDEFSRAAFALEVGQVSEPVVTKVGVHLIRVTEIHPGQKTFHDVRDDLSTAAARELFDRLAERNRDRSEVRYTGAIPYYDPVTDKLVDPRSPAE